VLELADSASAGAAILAGVRRGPAAAAPFAVSGPVRLVVDGTRCEAAAQDPPTGRVLLAVENRTETSASLLLLAAAAPHRLEEIGALARTFRVGVDEVPAWVTTVASLAAPARGAAYALADLPTTPVLPACGVGDPAAPTLVVGSPLEPEASR
jgi:hypothetical protein